MVTISESTRRTSYQPTTPTTVFPVGFPLFDNDDLRVTLDGSPFSSFTVSGTYINGIATDAAINVAGSGIIGDFVIDGYRLPRRTDQYKNGAPLKIDDHNYSLNRVEVTLQELRRDTDANTEILDEIKDDVKRAVDAANEADSSADRAELAAAAAEAAAGNNWSAFATVGAVSGVNIPAPVLFIRTAGYWSAGDGGAALYKRVSAEPSHTGKIKSLDGAWWELSEPRPNNKMFGAKVDGVRRNYTIKDTGEWGNLASFGWGTSGKTDDTVANQGLIDYVAAKGGGIGLLCAGVSVTGKITLKSGVVLIGEGGRSGTVLMLKDGANSNLVEGQNFASLWGTTSKQGIHHVGLIGVTLDGNWFNNTSGSGVAVYGYSNIFRDVSITLFRENGLMTMWNSGGPLLGVESTYDNVYVDTVGKTGIWNRGPNDSKWLACVVIDASQSTDHGFDAWKFEDFAPSRIIGCHANNRMYGAIQSYLNTNGTLSFRHNVALHDLSGGLDVTASHFEGAWYANAIFNGPSSNVDSSCHFYAPWNGLNVLIKQMIKFEGRVSGPGLGRPACVGIRLGDDDNGPNNLDYSIISSLINGCAAGTIDWTHAGNGMHVTARGYQDGGPSKIGTVPAGTITSVLIGGASDTPY